MAKYIIFVLGMPNAASWDGKWSGSGKKYVRSRVLTKDIEARHPDGFEGKSFYHNFGDGWGASVSTHVVEGAKAKAAAIKGSDGFCMYDWMITNILDHGNTQDLTDDLA